MLHQHFIRISLTSLNLTCLRCEVISLCVGVAQCSRDTGNRVHLSYWRDVQRICCRVEWSNPVLNDFGFDVPTGLGNLIGWGIQLWLWKKYFIFGCALRDGDVWSWQHWSTGDELGLGLFRNGWNMKFSLSGGYKMLWESELYDWGIPWGKKPWVYYHYSWKTTFSWWTKYTDFKKIGFTLIF